MFHHVSVLLEEAVEALRVKPQGVYVDCTLGGGGHSEAIAKRLSAQGMLIGLDQDETALAAAEKRLSPYPVPVRLYRSNFRLLEAVLQRAGVAVVDGILFDLGISSPQVDVAERGFSYHDEARMDMRMDRNNPLSAWEIVNRWPEEEIARILFAYGEENMARRIARAIVRVREEVPIETTTQLADVIKEAIPNRFRRTGPHPARRSFQALRIAVNDELTALQEGLHQAVKCLRPGGRLAVITFHSLEDRICKQVLSDYAKGCICPPSFPVCACGRKPLIRWVTRKPIVPTEDEVKANPRSRSAKLRVAEKAEEGKEG